MRKDNVVALLEHAANALQGSNLKSLKQQYNLALTEKQIPTSLQVDMKNFMENLRSALDYMAHDIYEIVLKPERDKAGEKEIETIYFPYGKTENDFKSSIGSSLPNLQALCPSIYAAIEGIQPHICGDGWLYEFCRILNEKKHNTLTPQKRTETKTMTASTNNVSVTMPINSPNFSIHQGENCSVTIGGIPVRLSNQGIEPLAPGLQRRITTWVSFQFADTGIHVLPLLEKALKNIDQLSTEIYSQLQGI